ncbi:MAG: hypothetical protein EA364_05565 [Balneolaceae bacterium]|nr:MAG: hypothetical protein EA364_05565 [Balneolaceae bacterium]
MAIKIRHLLPNSLRFRHKNQESRIKTKDVRQGLSLASSFCLTPSNFCLLLFAFSSPFAFCLLPVSCLMSCVLILVSHIYPESYSAAVIPIRVTPPRSLNEFRLTSKVMLLYLMPRP